MGHWITDNPLQLDKLLQETEDASCGGLVIFCGTVRQENAGKPVRAITYEAHVALAEKVLRELEAEVLSRFDVRRCRIQHRVGTLHLGETSVMVVVRAVHRSSPVARPSERGAYFYARNALWIIWRHYPLGEMFAAMAGFVWLAVSESLYQGTWVYLRAVRDAFAGLRDVLRERSPLPSDLFAKVRIPLHLVFTRWG